MNSLTVKELCRNLRKNQTEAEKVLWRLLRNRKLEGYKFLRQHPIARLNEQGKYRYFIADFYCAEKRLVIEADGPIHESQQDYDKNRDEVLGYRGIKVLRFTNEQVIKEGDVVLECIVAELAAR